MECDRAGVYRNNTLILGTTGQAKRLERIKIKFNNQTGYDGSIEYRVHRQTYGWTNWVKNNQFAGTKGEAKRLEGIQIRLTGEIAKHYSIRYRVHIQTYGWSQGWQYDGALAGTEGEARRLESLEVQLVPKSETMGLVSAWACMIAHNLLLFLLFAVYYISGKWNPMNRKTPFRV